MINRITLSHDQAQQAITDGNFSADIIEASKDVALILTQSWCPQWTSMNMSINGLKKGLEDIDLTIFTYEYDRSPIFNEFMNFKESVYRNWEVPYVRLYRNGRFIGDSNAMPAGRMVQKLRKA
jgi:hypothetical protein